MSKRNYNKMYDKPKAEVIEAIEQEAATVVETVVEPEVVVSVDPVTPVEESKQPDTAIAVVVGCSKLNVRQEPSPQARPLAVIDAASEVEVYVNETLDNYYKVCTAAGIEGYCVKEYLKLK